MDTNKTTLTKQSKILGLHSLLDTGVNIKLRALIAVALAATVGNSLGFLANLFLYGFNFVTAVCFFCAVLVILNLFFGLKSKHGIVLGYLMLFILDVFEFPLLTLTYGAVMYPYMIIGFHALALVTEGKKRNILCLLLGIYDIAIIVYSSLNPYIFGPQDSIGLMGSAIITFAISIFTVAALVIMWQSVYEAETTDIDSVTKVLSREGFNKKATSIINSDYLVEYVILYFNVASFKAINSIFGISGGNRCLEAIANWLVGSPFESRLVGRTNADHFVCLVKKENFDYKVLENVCQMPYTDKGRSIRVLLNCGIYEIKDRTIPITAMCDRAYTATRFLHAAGNKYYAEYDKLAEEKYKEETEILSEIDKAIVSEQFGPYYQPVIDCNTRKIVSAEALARWIHPDMGVVAPSVFIPVLERKDMISSLDLIIAKRVHDLLKKRSGEGKRIVPISVNLSRMDLYDRSMTDELCKMLSEKTGEGVLHRFEITESAYEDLSSVTFNTISALRKNGAAILVDDFGNGYSSLGLITDYEFDIIKLDIQFAAKITVNKKVRGVVQSLINMAHKLGAKVIAEGVETEEQFQILQQCGCDYVQGYYFYRPLSEEQFLFLLDSDK